MTPAPTALLKVCPLGMDERSRQTLQIFFERHAPHCALAEDVGADAVMIDMDAYSGKALLAEQLRAHPERSLILLSIAPLETPVPNAVLVHKPLRVDDFAQTLRQLNERLSQPRQETHFSANEEVLKTLQARGSNLSVAKNDLAALQLGAGTDSFYVGSMPDADLSNPRERAKVFYDPSEFLQGHFQRACALGAEKACVIRLSGVAFGAIDIYPFARRVISPTPKAVLHAAGRLPVHIADVSINPLPDAPQFPLENEKASPLNEMLWRLALLASRGRVTAGTDLDWPVYLKQWPNLTRLLIPPHAIRISGLWSRQRFSLAKTAQVLGVPQRFVFSFYSACVALDLAGPTQRAADTLVAPEIPRDTGKRGFFRLWLDKLLRERDAQPE